MLSNCSYSEVQQKCSEEAAKLNKEYVDKTLTSKFKYYKKVNFGLITMIRF